MTEPLLIIAIPSKGRLQENANAFFARAGLPVTRPGGDRNYRGRIDGLDGVEIAFLSASEIARELADGNVHMGVTGEDLLRETVPEAETTVALVTPLGFGHADVVVAVPHAWIDVRDMTDLDDVAGEFRARHGRRLKVATKYPNLTRAHFARHGITDYRIVESLGATEGAPASGGADLVVDITSTGATLAANGLKILADGIILRSQANLMAALAADWGSATMRTLRAVLDRVTAEERARTMREIRARLDAGARRVGRELAQMLDCRIPFDPPEDDTLVLLHCPADAIYRCVAHLRDKGAETITVARLDYVFCSENPLFAALAEKIGKARGE